MAARVTINIAVMVQMVFEVKARGLTVNVVTFLALAHFSRKVKYSEVM